MYTWFRVDNKRNYLILGLVIFLIFGILAFDVYVFKFGKFWEKQPQPVTSKSFSQTASVETVIDKARSLLVKTIPTIVVPALIPASADLSLVQDKMTPESFMVSWETKEATIGGRLAVSNDGKNISTFYLSVLKQPDIILSADLAEATATQFFSVETKGTWKCGISENQKYCENFWEEGNIKRGIGVYGLIPLANNKKAVSVFFCEHQQDAKVYPWQVCDPRLTKTGVK